MGKTRFRPCEWKVLHQMWDTPEVQNLVALNALHGGRGEGRGSLASAGAIIAVAMQDAFPADDPLPGETEAEWFERVPTRSARLKQKQLQAETEQEAEARWTSYPLVSALEV